MANRLAAATSPYLLQHADNPVDWWEWGAEAFDEARRRGVPVLLSVGYAACHWCHVMAHESFEDAETAAYLNEHFVAVKVDREERPDVDAVYMQATTAMTGHGGWPMTVVLDHEGTPFFAGTYFPDTPRGGQPSFRQVLAGLSEAWRERGDDVARVAGKLRAHLGRGMTAEPGPLDAPVLDAAVRTLAGSEDRVAGGLGGAPKFPPSMVLEALHRHALLARTPETAEVAAGVRDRTLEAMARGGLHDQLGGGFARYAVDRAWVVPHFEKMLYDNALLLGVYARRAATGTGPDHRTAALAARVARGTAAFLLRELRTSQGGFASALDADSLPPGAGPGAHAEEGAFYAWTPEQLVAVLGEEDGAWAAAAYEVTEAGTFEHGASTLQLPVDPEGPGAARLESVRVRLLAAREERPRPARDDKVVAAWNGLAISGLCASGLLLDEPDHVAAAVAAGELLAEVHTVDGRLRRVSRDGVVGAPAAVLEDLGCVASAYLDLLQATGDPVWLTRAGALLEDALTRFRADDGGFHDTAADAEGAALLAARPRDPSDNASPSGLSSTVHALLAYAALTGSGRHRTAAEEALAGVARLVAEAPRFAGWSMAAAEVALDGPVEVVVVGEPGPERAALAAAARRLPGAVVLVVDEAAAAAHAEAVPLLAGRTALDGRPAAYVCRGMVCERPVTDPAAVH